MQMKLNFALLTECNNFAIYIRIYLLNFPTYSDVIIKEWKIKHLFFSKIAIIIAFILGEKTTTRKNEK